MNWRQIGAAIRLALNTIREHKMRAFLTVLGVIIGTGTIIGVGSIITGLDGAITGVLRSFGSNNLVVFKFKIPHFGNLSTEERQRKPLTYENALAHRGTLPVGGTCEPVPVSVRLRLAPARRSTPSGTRATTCTSWISGGTEESYVAGGSAEMKEGRFFTDIENRHHMPVAVIGEDVRQSAVCVRERRRENGVTGRACTRQWWAL